MTRKKGFTLIELLVVIAIISLLMSIMVPALRGAKELASGAVCLNNQRQLVLAWTSYSSDNNGYLVGGSNYYSMSQGVAGGTPYRWVELPLYSDMDNPEKVSVPGQSEYSLDYRKNGIRAGKLFPYAADEGVYHCPGDRTMVKYEEPYASFRSYSITGLMNGEDFVARSGNSIYNPIVDYRTATVGANGGRRQLRTAVKINQIRSPGGKHVFVEEEVATHGQSANAGSFLLFLGNLYQPRDWPADYHKESSTVSFADGHAERRRWRTTDMLALIKGEISIQDADWSNNEDFDWLARGYIPIP